MGQPDNMNWGGQEYFSEMNRSGCSAVYMMLPGASLPRTTPRFNLTIIQCSDGTWIADEPVTGQFGVGVTPADAVADLFTSTSGYLKVMQARRHRLAPHLLGQLEWLEKMDYGPTG